MPGAYPVGGDAHYDVPLSNLAVEAFAAELPGMVADILAPAVPVEKQSNRYYKIEKDAFLRIPNGLRAPRDTAKKIYFTVSSDTYNCPNYALSTDFPLEELANADMQIRLRQNGVRIITNALRKGQEKRIADKVTSITNIGSGVLLTGSNKYGDPSSSPISDSRTAHAFMERQTGGLSPNVAIVDADTVRVLRTHPELLDMFKYTTGGMITLDQLRDALEVDKIYVARGKFENMPEGSASSSITNVWGNSLLYAHIEAPTGLQTVTAMLRMQWRSGIYPADFGVQSKVFDGAGEPKVEVLEAGHYQDEKIIAPDLLYLVGTTL